MTPTGTIVEHVILGRHWVMTVTCQIDYHEHTNLLFCKYFVTSTRTIVEHVILERHWVMTITCQINCHEHTTSMCLPKEKENIRKFEEPNMGKEAIQLKKNSSIGGKLVATSIVAQQLGKPKTHVASTLTLHSHRQPQK